jgi:hypothetical protein
MERTFWASGKEIEQGELTQAQWDSLARLRERWGLTLNVEVSPGFGGDYILIDVGSMILGIESDGHTHS